MASPGTSSRPSTALASTVLPPFLELEAGSAYPHLAERVSRPKLRSQSKSGFLLWSTWSRHSPMSRCKNASLSISPPIVTERSPCPTAPWTCAAFRRTASPRRLSGRESLACSPRPEGSAGTMPALAPASIAPPDMLGRDEGGEGRRPRGDGRVACGGGGSGRGIRTCLAHTRISHRPVGPTRLPLATACRPCLNSDLP